MQADKQKSNNLDNMVLSPDVGLLVEKDIAPFLVGKSGGKIYLRMDETHDKGGFQSFHQINVSLVLDGKLKIPM